MKGYISVELQRRVREHFGNRGAYCRTAEGLTVVIFEFEHIVPRSAGGATVFDNLCLSCPTCNRCGVPHRAARVRPWAGQFFGGNQLFSSSKSTPQHPPTRTPRPPR